MHQHNQATPPIPGKAPRQQLPLAARRCDARWRELPGAVARLGWSPRNRAHGCPPDGGDFPRPHSDYDDEAGSCTWSDQIIPLGEATYAAGSRAKADRDSPSQPGLCALLFAWSNRYGRAHRARLGRAAQYPRDGVITSTLGVVGNSLGVLGRGRAARGQLSATYLIFTPRG